MTHPFDAIQCCYIINLESRADRRAEMAEQLERIGLGFRSPGVRLFKAVRPEARGGFPSIGSRGCFMSHLGVLQDAIGAGFERILILEDDLNFAPDFMARAPAVMARVAARDCAVFYGGYQIDRLPIAVDGCAELPPTLAVRTTHFIGLQGPAIAAVAAHLSAMLNREPGHPDGGPMHVDGAYSWFRRAHPQWRTFAAVPELGHQRASRTDIHDVRWFDKLPGIRTIVAGVRRTRNA